MYMTSRLGIRSMHERAFAVRHAEREDHRLALMTLADLVLFSLYALGP
jgi:hypothetical protein